MLQGHTHILIDPSVRLAYQWRDAQDLGLHSAVGLNLTSWREAAGSLGNLWDRISIEQGLQVIHMS